jgi:hypothetical protein
VGERLTAPGEGEFPIKAASRGAVSRSLGGRPTYHGWVPILVASCNFGRAVWPRSATAAGRPGSKPC